VIVLRDGFDGVSNTNSSFVPNPKNEKCICFTAS
jgi:hypothetical protein